VRLPPFTAAFIRCSSFGLYTAGRLIRRRQDDLAATARDSSRNLLALGRAWDDAGLETQEGYAARDAIDADLDDVTRRIRQLLSNRELGADKKAPFTAIFPDGLAYYLESPVGEHLRRYQLLITRIEENLPEEDPIRLEQVPQLRQLLSAWSDAAAGLQGLLNRETVTRDRLAAARTDWEKRMNDTYATLCTRFDKRQAEQFFKKSETREKQSTGPESPTHNNASTG